MPRKLKPQAFRVPMVGGPHDGETRVEMPPPGLGPRPTIVVEMELAGDMGTCVSEYAYCQRQKVYRFRDRQVQ